MRSIFKNVAIITVFSVLTRMLGFLFRIFLSRTIGAEALGMYQVALSIFMVLLTFVSSGFSLVISRMTASYRVKSQKKEMSSLVATGTIIAVAVSVLLCVIVLLFKNLFANLFSDRNCVNILIVLLPSLIFSAIYSVFRGAMWGNDSYFSLCISELIEQVVKIAVCVLVLGVGMSAIESALAVAWSFTFSCFVSAVFVVLLYFVYGGKLRKPTNVYKKLLKQSTPITGVRVVGSLVQPIVALVLPSRLVATGYTVSQAMSLYGVALGMTLPLLFLPTTLIGSLSTALVPDVSRAFAKNEISHIQKRVETSLNFSLFISFLIVPLFVALGDKMGLFLYNNALSGTLLQHAAWIMVPMGITNISSSILNSVGLEVKSFVNYVIGGIFMFLVLIFMPQVIGIDALVVGMGVSATISAILNLFMLRKKMGISTKIIKKLAIFAFLSLPTLAIVSFVSALFEYCLPLIFNLILSSMLGVLVFVLFAMVFGVVDLSMFKSQIKDKLSFSKRKNAKIKQ